MTAITDGFPPRWFVQDRPEDNDALLCRETLGMWPGSACICLKPRAMPTSEWLHVAKAIAHAVVEREERISQEQQREEDKRLVAYLKEQGQ